MNEIMRFSRISFVESLCVCVPAVLAKVPSFFAKYRTCVPSFFERLFLMICHKLRGFRDGQNSFVLR